MKHLCTRRQYVTNCIQIQSHHLNDIYTVSNQCDYEKLDWLYASFIRFVLLMELRIIHQSIVRTSNAILHSELDSTPLRNIRFHVKGYIRRVCAWVYECQLRKLKCKCFLLRSLYIFLLLCKRVLRWISGNVPNSNRWLQSTSSVLQSHATICRQIDRMQTINEWIHSWNLNLTENQNHIANDKRHPDRTRRQNDIRLCFYLQCLYVNGFIFEMILCNLYVHIRQTYSAILFIQRSSQSTQRLSYVFHLNGCGASNTHSHTHNSI